jgi:integrase
MITDDLVLDEVTIDKKEHILRKCRKHQVYSIDNACNNDTGLVVWDAVIAWKDHILRKDVFRRNKTESLSHLSRLIAKGIIDIRQPLTEFLKTSPEDRIRIIDETIEWARSTKQTRRCVFRSFYRFAKETDIKPAYVVSHFTDILDMQSVFIGESLSSSEDKAKAQSLTDENIECLFNAMFDLNPRDGLATWMMWEFTRTIHEILDLKIRDIYLDKNLIRFEDGEMCPIVIPELKRCILEQRKDKALDELLFTTGKGTRIHAGQLVRNMKTASKLAKLPVLITPKILYAHAIKYRENIYKALSEEERLLLNARFCEGVYLHMKNAYS